MRSREEFSLIPGHLPLVNSTPAHSSADFSEQAYPIGSHAGAEESGKCSLKRVRRRLGAFFRIFSWRPSCPCVALPKAQ